MKVKNPDGKERELPNTTNSISTDLMTVAKKHRNEALVKNQMGHSDDGRMFFAHYRQLVSQKEAAAFWEIYRPVALLLP